MKKIDIIVADDHKLFRKGMVMILSEIKRIGRIREAENGKEVISLIKKEKTDVILMDLNMPVLDGIEASRHILKNYPKTKIVVLTMQEDKGYISNMLQIGVHGYLLKNAEPDEIEKTITGVHDKGFQYSSYVLNTLREGFMKYSGRRVPVEFSHREKEVLALICEELTSKEISKKLLINVRTVEKIRYNLIRKTHAKNAVGLVKYAIEYDVL